MTDGFIRLGPADLAEIARRLSKADLMSPEGARAWYSHDVGTLLQEVTALRIDAEDARARLMVDCVGLSPEPMSLGELADFWKAQATGIYEKAQVKKLREQINDLKAELDQLRFALQSAHDHAAATITAREQEHAEYEEKIKALQFTLDTHIQLLSAETVRVDELSAENEKLRREADDAANDTMRAVMTATTETETLKAEVRTLLMSALEALA